VLPIAVLAEPEAAIAKHSFPRTNKNETGLDQRGKSVLGFLKLETASI